MTKQYLSQSEAASFIDAKIGDGRDWYNWLSRQRRAKRTLIQSSVLASRMRVYQVADLEDFVERVKLGQVVLKSRNNTV